MTLSSSLPASLLAFCVRAPQKILSGWSFYFSEVSDLTYNLGNFFPEVKSKLKWLYSPVLHFLSSVCRFEEHQGNPFLPRSHLTLMHVSWDFMHLDVQRHSEWNTRLYIHTNTPTLCGAVNTMIAFWPHFLPGGDKSLFSHSHAWSEIQLCL